MCEGSRDDKVFITDWWSLGLTDLQGYWPEGLPLSQVLDGGGVWSVRGEMC